MTGTIKLDAEGMSSTILNLVSSVQGGGELIRAKGIRVESLAQIESMSYENGIVFKKN